MEKGTIYLTKESYQEITAHARETYPNECCGVLIGKAFERDKRVLKVYKVDNKNVERLRDRYTIDPGDILRIEKDIRGKGLEMLGFYHSHPDHPPLPSRFDRERAWTSYSYVIIAVNGSGDIDVRSWQLIDEGGDFVEERIEVE